MQKLRCQVRVRVVISVLEVISRTGCGRCGLILTELQKLRCPEIGPEHGHGGALALLSPCQKDTHLASHQVMLPCCCVQIFNIRDVLWQSILNSGILMQVLRFLRMVRSRLQVMLQRIGPRSWAPDFVFPEPAFRPLPPAAGDCDRGSTQQGNELRAVLRVWDSADPAALLRAVLQVIDRYTDPDP